MDFQNKRVLLIRQNVDNESI